MKPARLGLTLAALCLLDAAATQIQMTSGINGEANPIGAQIIKTGWAWVWTFKVGAAVGLLCAITRLLQSKWGKCLVYAVAGAYTIVTFLHLVIFFIT